MRACLLCAVLALSAPALADTPLRMLQNDSDAPVKVQLDSFEREVPRYKDDTTLNLVVPQGEASLTLRTRDGLWHLSDRHGKLFAWKEGGEPRAISDRSGEYIMLWVDPTGRPFVRRWPYWYGR
ncbi:MAG: hypothetical protein AB1758_35660 [Candidatus Eremiobacterota bacterium]